MPPADPKVHPPGGPGSASWSNRDGDREVYVMDADGSGLIHLTHDAAEDRWPRWSPVGRWIAYVSPARAGARSTSCARTDPRYGRSPRGGWTSTAGSPAADMARRDYNAVHCSALEDRYEIHVINADGSNQRRLTHLLRPRPAR